MRKDYLDVAKGIGILLVVVGHSLEIYLAAPEGAARTAIFTVWKFIYSFHMPLFFLVSGMVMTRLAGVEFRKAVAGALFLLVIATLLQIFGAPLRLLLPHPDEALPASLAGAVRYTFWPAIKLEGYALVAIWFLPCLALVRLAVWLVANLPRPAAVGLLLVLGLLCGAEHALGVGYFQMRSLIVAVAFFGIGQRIGELPLERLSLAACWAGFAGALLLTLASFDANHGCSFAPAQTCPGPRYGGFAVLMVSGAFGFLPLFILTSLAGSSAVLGASILLARTAWAGWLALIGRRTLELLIVNACVLVFVQPLLAPSVTDLSPWLVLVPLVLAQLAATFVLHPVLNGFVAFARKIAARMAALPLSPRIRYLGDESEERR